MIKILFTCWISGCYSEIFATLRDAWMELWQSHSWTWKSNWIISASPRWKISHVEWNHPLVTCACHTGVLGAFCSTGKPSLLYSTCNERVGSTPGLPGDHTFWSGIFSQWITLHLMALRLPVLQHCCSYMGLVSLQTLFSWLLLKPAGWL